MNNPDDTAASAQDLQYAAGKTPLSAACVHDIAAVRETFALLLRIPRA